MVDSRGRVFLLTTRDWNWLSTREGLRFHPLTANLLPSAGRDHSKDDCRAVTRLIFAPST